MKRTISALALCITLLAAGSFVITRSTQAKEDVLPTLLSLPAPPPPNPLFRGVTSSRPPTFYDKSRPPKDNAPIDDLLDYWSKQSEGYQELVYNPKPSEKTLERLMAEVEKNPEKLSGLLNIFPDNRQAAEFVKGIFDRTSEITDVNREERASIKRWLTYNSPYYSSDLARAAQQVRDSNEYVTNQEELLALTRADFDRARPIIDRTYSNSGQPVSQVLAKWALYRHALDEDSVGDIDRYRDELKAVVEDKTATAGMRDLAMDALVKEKEWPGRDEWYYSLLSDETLADLRVNGQSYTGLTTILIYSPAERYRDKMIELVKSENPVIRGAATRNLIVLLRGSDPEVVKVLLPWLENPTWAKETGNERQAIVGMLRGMQIPESVPGLIKALDEKAKRERSPNGYAANAMANAANAMANISGRTAQLNSASNNARPTQLEEYYPLRSLAIGALVTQADLRAVPALRRVLNEVDGYERSLVVKALLVSNGFSIAEQVDALESVAKSFGKEEERRIEMANAASWADPEDVRRYAITDDYPSNAAVNASVQKRPVTTAELRAMLGEQLVEMTKVSDDLVKAVVDRIEVLDTKDPMLARYLRKIMLNWSGNAVNAILLRDLKNDKLESAGIVRLLGARKELREKMQAEVYDVRTGTPTATALSVCIVEDPAEFEPILDGTDPVAKTALLACARLIRARLPLAKVTPNLRAKESLLVTAAERYLESEDSPEARAIVLSLHPNEAKILGATTAFSPDGKQAIENQFLPALFASVNESFAGTTEWMLNESEDIAKTEKKLQKEVVEDQELLGVYAYKNNFVRIYKDRAVFSWEEDTSRYRERVLAKEEFAELKEYLAANKVDELVPFLGCAESCEARELLMLGRNGGRRVYAKSGRTPEFFAGLDKYFENVKLPPSRIKYALSKEIPGLEIVFADDNLNAETFWKNGGDMRLLVSDAAAKRRIDKEIENELEVSENMIDGAGEDEDEGRYERQNKLRENRKYESFAWHTLADGNLPGAAARPPGVEAPPIRDTLSVQPTEGQWKARAGDIEIRTDSEGLYKVVRGKLVKLRTGNYDTPLVTPNARWVIATKYEDEGPKLVRVNLVTGKEFRVASDSLPGAAATAFIPTINKVLIVARDYGEDYEYEEESAENDSTADDPRPGSYFLLDADTGVIQPAQGEFGPLAQQTFRPLQKAAKPNEFWAAIQDSEKNETQIGIYDTSQFAFRLVLKLPKIIFNSMNLWVDEAERKAYFVYRGHLLAIPLPK